MRKWSIIKYFKTETYLYMCLHKLKNKIKFILKRCFEIISTKKSQSALEFLTTYAWAFIVIAIVIGAIAYFGVLRPSKILPDRCNFNVGFDCQAYKIGSDGTFNLRLKNGLGQVITVTGFTLSSESTTAFSCTTPPANPTNWATGDIKDLAWSGCNAAAVGFVAGEKGKVLVKIDFYDARAGTAYARAAEGEVFATIT